MFIKKLFKYLNCFCINEKSHDKYIVDLMEAISLNDLTFFSSDLNETLLTSLEKNKIMKKIIDYNRKDFIEVLSKDFISSLDKVSITRYFFKADRKSSIDVLNALEQRIRKDFDGEIFHNLIFEIKKEDLLYGCREERKKILVGFYKIPYPIVDFLNNEIMDLKDGTYYGNKYPNSKEAQKHASYVEHHPKYSPDTVRHFDPRLRDKRVKRFCKAGITRVLESKSKEQIHFLLGNFDPMKAFAKKEDCIMFTNSEFRLIYRKWLINPKLIDEKIIFWTKSLEKITPSNFFNLIGKNILYVPTSCRDKALLKMQQWASLDKNCNSSIEK